MPRNKMFDIRFVHDGTEALIDPGPMESVGEITIGQFREDFIASLTYWDELEYMRQWNDGIERLCSGQHESSALIQSLEDPATSHHIFWWVLYKVDSVIAFQNQMLILADLSCPFSPDDPYIHIRPRHVANDDGLKISEWTLPFVELADSRAK
jgi:hypothetical protein